VGNIGVYDKIVIENLKKDKRRWYEKFLHEFSS